MKRLLQMEAGGGKPGRLWAGKRQPAGRIDDGFTLIVDDKLCFWKIEFSLQAPSTSTTRQPTWFFREICIEAGAQEEKALQISWDSSGWLFVLVISSIFTIQLFSAATCCRGSVRTTTPSAWRTRKTLSPPRSTSPASGSSSMIIIALVVNRPYLQAGGGDGDAQQEDPQS